MIEVRVVERCELNIEDLSVESLFAHQSLHVKWFRLLSRNLKGIRDPVVILNQPLSVDGMPLHIVFVVHVQLLLALWVALKLVNSFNFDQGFSRDFSQVFEKIYFAAVVVEP
jgi:hypothetical protein